MMQQAEIALPQRPKINHRAAVAQLPEDQPAQRQYEKSRQCLHPPECGTQPIPLLPLVEHHFPANHGDDEERQTDRVKTGRLPPLLRALGREIVRVTDYGVAGCRGQKADWDVDVKDPPPRIVIRNPAAEGRPDDRRDQGSQAKQRHRGALLLPREGIEQHFLAARLQPAAREALDHAEQNQLIKARGDPTQPRGYSKYNNRREEVVAAAESVDQPAGDRQDNGVGGEVTGDDPFAVVDRRRQAACDIAQRHHSDSRVEHLHKGRHHHCGGHQPRVHRHAGPAKRNRRLCFVADRRPSC
jgi:hypothetical protein